MKNAQSTFYTASLGANGIEYIGASQASGTISAAATYASGAQTKLTVNSTTGLQAGQSINVTATGYTGVRKIIEVIDATNIAIDVAFGATATGTWDLKAAKGKFFGFMPLTDIAANEISSISFLNSSSVKGDPIKVPYLTGVTYVFPGVITEISLSGLVDVMLFNYDQDYIPNN